MKNWSNPVAIAQQFAANEYVSACYKIYCQSPLKNESFRYWYADSNGNGVYDEADTLVEDAKKYNVAGFRGCKGYHTVRYPGPYEGLEPNGFAVSAQGNYVEPIYFWYGDAIGPDGKLTGDIGDFHVSDLTVPNVLIPADNPNFS